MHRGVCSVPKANLYARSVSSRAPFSHWPNIWFSWSDLRLRVLVEFTQVFVTHCVCIITCVIMCYFSIIWLVSFCLHCWEGPVNSGVCLWMPGGARLVPKKMDLNNLSFVSLYFIKILQFARAWKCFAGKSIQANETVPLRRSMCSVSIWCCLVRKSMILLPPVALNAREAREHLASCHHLKKYNSVMANAHR